MLQWFTNGVVGGPLGCQAHGGQAAASLCKATGKLLDEADPRPRVGERVRPTGLG